MAFRRDERLVLASVLALGLGIAITAPTRTSSATYGSGGASTGGKATAVGGSASTGGASSTGSRPTAVGGTMARTSYQVEGGSGLTSLVLSGGRTSSSSTKAPTSGGSTASTGKSSSLKAGNAGAKNSTGSVAPPVGIDAGPSRPTWHEQQVVLTVDPSYLALPYAQAALEGALAAWTSEADQLPKVTLRYPQDEVVAQSDEENLADHRIFFAPNGDKRAKGALAITLVTADEKAGAILDADILVNGGHLFTDVKSAARKDSASIIYDLQDVITHEFGHWFGLDEDYADPEATMYAYVYPGETKKRDLSQADITAVQLAYWQADNPSENAGCSLSRRHNNGAGWVIGFLAACLLGRPQPRNRRSATHVLARSRRLHP